MRFVLKTKINWLSLNLLIILCLVFLASCSVGRYPLSPFAFFELINNTISSQDKNVLLNIRIPRALVSVLMGGALGLAGGIFQKVFRSPLASPDILGIANGASLGAVISIVFVGTNMVATQMMAFSFGILSLFIIVFLCRFGHGFQKIFSMIVSGIILSSLSSAGVMFLKYTADPERKLPAIEYWIMGGLYNIRSFHVKSLIFIVCFVGIFLYLFRWKLTLVELDQEELKVLGINVEIMRFLLLFLGTLLVSISVSIGGVIGFIGLISPYMARLLTNKFNSWGLVNSFLIGGIILGFSDMIARSIHESEIPVGIIVSLISAPVLLYMMFKGYEKND